MSEELFTIAKDDSLQSRLARARAELDKVSAEIKDAIHGDAVTMSLRVRYRAAIFDVQHLEMEVIEQMRQQQQACESP